eukprot:83272-Rhodomonas_salina.6
MVLVAMGSMVSAGDPYIGGHHLVATEEVSSSQAQFSSAISDIIFGQMHFRGGWQCFSSVFDISAVFAQFSCSSAPRWIKRVGWIKEADEGGREQDRAKRASACYSAAGIYCATLVLSGVCWWRGGQQKESED